MKLFSVIRYKQGNESKQFYTPGWDVDALLQNCPAIGEIVEQTPYTQKLKFEVIKAYYNDGVNVADTSVTDEELKLLIKYLKQYMDDELIEIEEIVPIEVWGLKEPQ